MHSLFLKYLKIGHMAQNYSLGYYLFDLEDCLAQQLPLHLSKKILVSP